MIRSLADPKASCIDRTINLELSEIITLLLLSLRLENKAIKRYAKAIIEKQVLAKRGIIHKSPTRNEMATSEEEQSCKKALIPTTTLAV